MQNKKCSCSEKHPSTLWGMVRNIALTGLVLAVVGLGIYALVNRNTST